MESTSGTAPVRVTLREALVEHFSLEDLDLLCSDLGIDPESLDTQGRGKEAWVNELLRACLKLGRLDDLRAQCERARPGLADWSTLAVPDLPLNQKDPYSVEGLPNPYLGLRPFTYADRNVYAGRQRAIEEAVATLATPGQQRVVLFVTGASGSGKSSFAQAGLLPALESFYAARGKHVRRATFRPSLHPLAMLDDARAQLETQDAGIDILIIDQFEELFTQSQPDQREQLLQWLTHLPPFDARAMHVIVTLRSDYLDELFNLDTVWNLAKANTIELRAMSAGELQEAIQRPLQARYPDGEKRFEPALLDKLAQDASPSPTLLPLLQVTLEELWKKGRLTLDRYGTLTDAIKQRADLVIAFKDYDAATPAQPRGDDEQAAMLGIFLDLVNVSLDEDVRRDVRISRPKESLPPERRRLVDDLAQARLLTVSSESGAEMINIIHESLILNWDRLRVGVQSRRQQLQQRARFEQQLRDWLANSRSDDYALTGVHLAQARELERQGDVAVQSQDAKAYLQHSAAIEASEREQELAQARALAEEQRRRADEGAASAQRLRQRAVLLTIAFALAGVLAIAALILSQQSRQNEQNALAAGTRAAAGEATAEVRRVEAVDAQATGEARRVEAVNAQATAVALAATSRSRELAALALNRIGIQPEQAVRIAIEANQAQHTLEADDVLRRAVLLAPALILTGSPPYGDIVLRSPDLNGVQFSQDGNIVVTLGDRSAAQLWDARTGARLREIGSPEQHALAAQLAPDGKRLVTAAGNNATVWDLATDTPPVKLASQRCASIGARFSGNGQRVVTFGQREVCVWNAMTGAVVAELVGHTRVVWGAEFSPDDQRILTASYDGTARVWDARTGAEVFAPVVQNAAMLTARFSPDGTQFVTVASNGSVRVRKTEDGTQILQLPQLSGDVRGAQFLPGGTRIVTFGDGLAQVWDAITGREIVAFRRHDGLIYSAHASPDGQRIVTASSDGTARVWDAASGDEIATLRGDGKPFISARFSSDGRRVLATDESGTARLWYVDGSGEVPPDPWQERLLQSARSADGSLQMAYSADERRIATISATTVFLWDASTGTQIASLQGHRATVKTAVFLPGAQQLLTTSDDGTARAWDANTGAALYTLRGGDGRLRSAGFAPNGKRVLTVDNQVHVWDAQTGERVAALDIQDPIVRAEFSHDSQHVLIAHGVRGGWYDSDWNVGVGRSVTQTGPTSQIPVFAPEQRWFSAGGQRFVAFDGSAAVVYDAATGATIAILRVEDTPITAVALSADGARAVTAFRGGTARVWDVQSGQLLALLQGHDGDITSVYFTADGAQVVTSSNDGTARLWDAASGAVRSVLRGYDRVRADMRFTPDGSRVATPYDGTLRIHFTRIDDLVALAASRLNR